MVSLNVKTAINQLFCNLSLFLFTTGLMVKCTMLFFAAQNNRFELLNKQIV